MIGLKLLDQFSHEEEQIISKMTSALNKVEAKLGFKIPENIAEDVRYYSIRKCDKAGKPRSYLPVLYETELEDYFMRLEITMKGVAQNVQRLLKVPV